MILMRIYRALLLLLHLFWKMLDITGLLLSVEARSLMQHGTLHNSALELSWTWRCLAHKAA